MGRTFELMSWKCWGASRNWATSLLPCLISCKPWLCRKLTRKWPLHPQLLSLPLLPVFGLPLMLLAANTGLYATSEESLSGRLVILPVTQLIHFPLSWSAALASSCIFFWPQPPLISSPNGLLQPQSSSTGLWPSVMTCHQINCLSLLFISDLSCLYRRWSTVLDNQFFFHF